MDVSMRRFTGKITYAAGETQEDFMTGF
jgi:hypothetical protein